MDFDDDYLKDAEEDARTVAFIRNYLPQELKDKFTDEELYYFLDVLVEYYASSGILDQEPDADGYIEIDQEQLARHLAATAEKEGRGAYDPEELLFVVEAELEYGNEGEEDED